uniref:Uncharacterized protein n=1 Tax=Caenorhabditis japonica TaxID=281687 RepID=A0A8R1ILQ6_CAEJA
MRTPTKIVARSSQIGPNTRAMPSSASRQPPPHPLVTGTAVNHDEILYVLRKTQRKPISPSIVQRQQRASRQQTIHPKPPGTETTIQSDHRETRKTTTPPQKDHTLGLGRPDLQSINVKDQGRSGEKGGRCNVRASPGLHSPQDTRHQSTLPLLPVDNPRSSGVSLVPSYISPPVSHLLRLADQRTRLASGRTPPGLSRSRARIQIFPA